MALPIAQSGGGFLCLGGFQDQQAGIAQVRNGVPYSTERGKCHLTQCIIYLWTSPTQDVVILAQMTSEEAWTMSWKQGPPAAATHYDS